jgi:hypothetical protein
MTWQSLSISPYKQALEARLTEIEDAQKIFGRKQVYVRSE